MRRMLGLAWMLLAGVVGWAQGVSQPAITGIAFARFYTTDAVGAEHPEGGG